MESRGRKMDSIAIRQWAEEALQKLTQKHSGGFLARGQLAMVGERGAELVMTDSPAQVMSAARTEQLEMPQ